MRCRCSSSQGSSVRRAGYEKWRRPRVRPQRNLSVGRCRCRRHKVESTALQERVHSRRGRISVLRLTQLPSDSTSVGRPPNERRTFFCPPSQTPPKPPLPSTGQLPNPARWSTVNIGVARQGFPRSHRTNDGGVRACHDDFN